MKPEAPRATASAMRLTFVVAAVLAGCSGGVCPVQRFDDPARAMDAYSSMRAPGRVVRAEARVDRRDGGGRIRGTVLMFLERPDRVRFDAMTQFGPAAILTSDGTTFALTDLRENVFYVGPTCPGNIERLLGIPLSGRDVALLLLGEAPRIEATDRTISCEGGVYRVTLTAADGRTQTLDLEVRQSDVESAPEEQRLRLRRTEVRSADGALEWRVEWDDYRFVEDPASEEGMGIAMPYRVRFEHPARGIDTLVRFESLDLNVEVPPEAFVQEPRPGLEVRDVACEGGE
jgi:hypothetical protein